MKKIFLVFVLLFFTILNVYASYTDVLNTTNDILNIIDRTEYTINRTKNKVPKVDNTPKTTQDIKTNSSPLNTTSNTENTTNNDEMPLYQQNGAASIQEGQYTYEQNNVYTGNAKTLGELPAGSIVMDPTSIWITRFWDNYSGKIKAEHPVIWVKLEDNHYSQGSTLLFSQYVVARYPFCHKQKGLRDWAESDLRRFLRTTFYNHLSQGFKNAIVEVTIPYADMSGNPKSIKDNFFVFSIVEWGLSDRKNNGTVVKYNDLPSLYESKSWYYVPEWDSFSTYDEARSTVTRTINRPVAKSAGYTDDVFGIWHSGTLTTEGYATNLQYVRPAVNLKSSTKIKGPYTYKYGIDKKNSFIYYVLDFDDMAVSSKNTTTNNSQPNTTIKSIKLD